MKSKFISVFAAFAMACMVTVGLSACSEPALGIKSAALNSGGELIITYTDGSTSNLGKIKGENGADGSDGSDGVGIKNAVIDKDGNLIITLTDGNTVNCGKVGGNGGVTDPDEGTQGMLYTEIKENDVAVAYSVRSIGTASDIDLVIPEKHNGLPVTEIENEAFFSCKRLTSVKIPDSVKIIGEYAFQLCEGLTEIDFGKGVEEIRAGAFYECNALEKVFIPDNVKFIGEVAFSSCKMLTEITFGTDASGDGLHEVGDCAFGGNYLLENLTLPDSLSTMGWGAIMHNTALTKIKLPDSLKEIPEYAFNRCDVLEGVIINDGVTRIRYSAFFDMPQFRYAVVPASVTEIVSYAFHKLPEFKCIYYKGTPEQWKNIKIGSNNTTLNGSEICYYSEQQPTAEGSFWHFENGAPVKW